MRSRIITICAFAILVGCASGPVSDQSGKQVLLTLTVSGGKLAKTAFSMTVRPGTHTFDEILHPDFNNLEWSGYERYRLMHSLQVAARHPARRRPLDHSLYFYETRTMEQNTAVRALGALAHDTRLTIYRLLVQAGPQGLAVGTIGEKLNLAPATLSFHLASLRHAGLVTERREGRTLFQSADYDAMNGLVGYLSENCCQGADCGVPACAPASAKQPSRTARKETRHEKTARTRSRR